MTRLRVWYLPSVLFSCASPPAQPSTLAQPAVGEPAESSSNAAETGDGGHRYVSSPWWTPPDAEASPDASASGETSSPRGLGPEAIHRTVVAHRSELMACYELSGGPDAGTGGLTVSWRIAPDGTVTDAAIVSSTLDNERAKGCVLRRVRAFRFPPADGPSQVTFPFAFGVRR